LTALCFLFFASEKAQEHKSFTYLLESLKTNESVIQPMTSSGEQSDDTVAIVSQRETNDTPRYLADVFVEEDARTQATLGKWQRFRLNWLTAYRVLIFGVLVINLTLLILFVDTSPTAEALLTATAANITAAIVLRQEEVINTAFTAVSKLPPTLPYSIRRIFGDIHHYGGVHIGCALSALLWYIVFTALKTIRVLDLLKQGTVIVELLIDILTAYAVLLAILSVCIAAHPYFRKHLHNTFETTHRFGGWATLIALWIHTGTATMAPDTHAPLYTHPSLWLLVLTSALIALPWFRIRRVPISAYHLTSREIQLTFPYTHMPFTSTIRVSTAPLTEWHAFATIPVSETTAKLLISKAGDWTTDLLAFPPSHLWIRHPPARNFLTLAPLFNSLLLVATGAGIGPLLSLLMSQSVQRMCAEGRKAKVLWCVAAPDALRWAFVLDTIRGVDSDPKIFDSRLGRPDVAFEARHLAHTEGLEAVMVVSNPKVTKEVVHECEGAGLAAYGAVFSS
jgi:hypothetical protein